MSSRPRRNAPTRERIRRRFPRPNYRTPRPGAPVRRIFRRRLDRPVFRRRLPATFNSYLSLGVTIGVVLILGSIITLFERAYTDRINPHISVDGIPMGGVSLADAASYLSSKEAERAHQTIFLHAGNQTFQVTSAQFHATYDTGPALAQAMRDGHDADLATRLWNQVIIMIQGHNYAVTSTHDRAAVSQYLAHTDARITTQPLPALVGIRGSQAVITREPVLGRRLDRAAAARVLNYVIATRGSFDLNLPLQTTISPVNHEVAQAAVDQANTLLSQPTYFSFGTKIRAYFLKPADVAKLLTFTTTFNQTQGYAITLGIDKEKLREAMAPIAAVANIAPHPAYYLLAPGTAGGQDYAVAQPDVPGVTIDTDSTAALILHQNGTHTAVIPPLHPHDAFDLKAAHALRFDTEEGIGLTGMTGSSTERLNNIAMAAKALDNVRLDPGATLSVTGVISPVITVQGYTQGLNVLANKDISGVNGGVTQVASALFQAAYQAGLPIIERRNYPYFTSFNGPVGYDAMVVARPSGPDLQIINNTKHVLLILLPKPKPNAETLTAYIFNSSVVSRTVHLTPPQVTLNEDGSTDATVSRTVSGDTTGQDTIASHYDALDSYP